MNNTLTRIIVPRTLQYGATQSLGANQLAGPRVVNISFFLNEDDFIGGNLSIGEASLTPNASVNGGQPVVVCLAPTIEGVMVALGTLDSNSQKRLGDRLHKV
jgi:hypothetical protein